MNAPKNLSTMETVSFCEGDSEKIRNLSGSLYGVAIHKEYIAPNGTG